MFFMKKFYLLLIVLFGFGSVSGQIINFSDANFKSRLMSSSNTNAIAKNLNGEYFKVDSNNDGEIQISEAQNVSYLKLYEGNIISLEGISNFNNLEFLNCEFNDIEILDVSELTNLIYLYCNSNLLYELNVENLYNLKELDASGNNFLTTFDATSLINIESLNISFCVLSSLNIDGLQNLVDLNISGNPITSIALTNLPNLKNLTMYSTYFLTIDLSALTSLESLIFAYNYLTSLDLSSLTNLKFLNCDSSEWLTNLNISSLVNLESLSCYGCNLSTLDISNLVNLQHLNCKDNQIGELDFTNLTSLTSLHCDGNNLTTLDLHNSPVVQLTCEENLLTNINLKNGADLGLHHIFMNPLQYICVDEDKVSEWELIISQLEYTTEVNSYCSFTPGGAFYMIDGSSTFDENDNGCYVSDAAVRNLKFNISNGSQTGTIIANDSGEYSIPVQAGTHIITPIIENPTFFNITPATATITFPDTTSPFIQNFCITPNGIHPDLEVAIIPTNPARPGFNATYKIIFKNKGNTQQSGTVNFTYNNAVLDYVIANPVYNTQTTGAMTWDFANLQPFETREIAITLNVNSPMETPAVNADDILNYTATITSAATDDMPLDNTFSLPQTVVNSFDPNDKTCLEGTSLTPDMIGKYVHYMIRFENTGTFPAENIVVKDIIDATKFDVASLIPLNASHDYVTRITGNKVEFIFENINLPFDDATNDGYIVFKIKTKPTLVLGDSFSNSASIYFDYNFPIVTDPAVTTFAVLGTQDFVFNNYLTVYPNPANNILNITAKQSIELKSMEVYNILGQLVLSIPNANGVDKVDVSNLNAGTYFLKVSSDKGTSNVKFIKN